ncbi:MAG TPA: hypothetical protein DCZ13_09555 [Porticoccaceae bacterium]|nr:hypothetical protein [Porticoccaceae bacterium]
MDFVVAVIALITYSMVEQFMPHLTGFAFLAQLILLPAIIVLSLAFRTRCTRWRGIHFSFAQDFAGTCALEQMMAQGIDPSIFATMMKKLANFYDTENKDDQAHDPNLGEKEKEKEKESSFLKYLSTHPPTQKRINRFLDAANP